MRRLYFTLPDIATTRRVVNELLLKRINSDHIHVMAAEGVELGDLPEATLFERSDFIPAVERGLAIGGITGVLVGVIATAFPPAGLTLGGGAILATALAGAVIGAWVSGMIGVDVPNSQIERFEQMIQSGQLLMMVDVPKDMVTEIEELVHSHHPQAALGGTEPHIPAFP